MARAPIATYRVQLNQGFQFGDAVALAPYLRDLGISDLYSSPILKARRGSMHGYDIVDPTRLNPELGGEEGLNRLVRELRANSMGLLLDIVPNHQAADTTNPRWMDVLGNGQNSIHARMFDIDWDPPAPGLKGRVLVPVLNDLYGRVLENQDLSLGLGPQGFFVRYHDDQLPLTLQSWAYILESGLGVFHPFLASDESALLEIQEAIAAASQPTPFRLSASQLAWEQSERKDRVLGSLASLRAKSPAAKQFLDWTVEYFNGVKRVPASFELLDHLLDSQRYRLAFWRMTSEAINYRRFFDLSHLIGVRVEDPVVFAETHRLILRLARNGVMTGLRIDHIDGPADPLGYLWQLQEALGGDGRQAGPHTVPGPTSEPLPFYVVVEKILTGRETLAEEWPVHGTTGYDFLNAVNGLFVDPPGLQKLKTVYEHFIGVPASLEQVIHEKKEQALNELFNAELQALGRSLAAVAEGDRLGRDIPRSRLLQALAGVSACLPVYRTYMRAGESIAPQDRHYVGQALDVAAHRNPAPGQDAFDFLRRLFFGELSGRRDGEAEEARRSFIARWQQLTGPLAAKGVEDTALFVYNPLISLNEVGGQGLPISPGEFHDFNACRRHHWPDTLNATSTHDTKRSEDVRARINALSELPKEWAAHLSLWSQRNLGKRSVVQGAPSPDPNEEVMIYQTLLGAWPFAETDVPPFEERMKDFVVKALREAEIHSSWLYVNDATEQAAQRFVEALFQDSGPSGFLEDFLPFQRRIAYYGALSSLAQTLLKVASPGVPDFYQGTEMWDFSLVDPDNRRPVRFDRYVHSLRSLQESKPMNGRSPLEDILSSWRDGRPKLYLIWKALALRNARAGLFRQGAYVPLLATGAKREHVVAFARTLGNHWVIAAVPRLVTGVSAPTHRHLCTGGWEDTTLALPPNFPTSWTDALTGKVTPVRHGEGLPLGDVFAHFPVALLEGKSG